LITENRRLDAISRSLREWPYLVGLALAGLALLFYRLGSPGLMDPDEGRYAEIAREMLVLKDWLIPHLNFLPYLEKPPLVYWLTALSLQVFGWSAGAARLPVAFCALGGLFLTYYLGRIWWGPRTGLLSALILATAGGYVILGRLIILDMPLTFFLSLGIALGYLSAAWERRSLLVWAYAALAAAVLSKGPVALVLAGLIWGIWTILDRRRSPAFWLHPGGLALLAALALPWFILVAAQFPEFPRFFLWEHHLARYAAGTMHAKPVYYFIPILLGLMMPWSWLLPWALARCQPGATPERLFLLVWAGVIFLFFSVSGGKLASYILPAFLPLALLLGESLGSLGGRPEQGRPPGLTASLSVWAVAATTLALLVLGSPAFLASQLAKAAVLEPYFSAGLIIMAITPLAALFWRSPVPLAAGALLLAALLPMGMERLSNNRSPKEAGLTLRAHWQPGAALVGVRQYSQGLSFYARQPFHLLAYPTELDFGRQLRPESGFFFASPQEMAAFCQASPLVFFWLKGEGYPRLEALLPGEFRLLARWKDCLLVAYTGK
jgi:4-amino-4-deoxy-L-arabinose transferase-like glycosyltransferase